MNKNKTTRFGDSQKICQFLEWDRAEFFDLLEKTFFFTKRGSNLQVLRSVAFVLLWLTFALQTRL